MGRGLLMSREIFVGKGNNYKLVVTNANLQDSEIASTPFVALLMKACAQKKDLHKGACVHADIVKRGVLEKSCYVASSLVSMYAKCGELAKAQQVVDKLPVRNIVSWNALISGYAQQGQSEQVLNCFEHFQCKGLLPDTVTFTSVLRACASIRAADKGKQIHNQIVSQGLFGKTIALGNALVDMYTKCGVLSKAQQVFDELPVRDVVSWSALIAGYAQQGQGEEALICFERMQHEGLSPNDITFACILKACGSIGAVDKGKDIHHEIIKQGLLKKNIVLGTALVDMYAKCHALATARQLFDELPNRDVVSWNALIAGYVQQELGEEALKCFEQMQCEGLCAQPVTFACILKACGSVGAVDKGKQVHVEMVRQGLLGKNIVLATALVDMYAKCGALAKAQRVLDELAVQSVEAWSALIAGYAHQEQSKEAINCYERMQHEGFSPNAVTFACILKACGCIGAVDKGKQIHDEIINQELLEKNIVLGNALVDMYAKCGALAKAQRVLDELPIRDVVSWSALIAGYSQQEKSEEALNCLLQMQHEGLSPNAITFTCLLSACSRSGLADEGQMCLANMSKIYGITPCIEHHVRIVGLFGCAGHFDKAIATLKKMPSSDYFGVWSVILDACKKWGNVKLGKWAFEHATEADKNDVVAYICMANIYVAAGMCKDADEIEAMRLKLVQWKK